MGTVHRFFNNVEGLRLANISDEYKMLVIDSAYNQAHKKPSLLNSFYGNISALNNGNDALLEFIPHPNNNLVLNHKFFFANSSVNFSNSPFSIFIHKAQILKFAEFQIFEFSFIKNLSFSRYSLIPSSPNFKAIKVDTSRQVNTTSHSRENDCEYKLLEDLSEYLGYNVTYKANINLYTRREPCLSCEYVILQFIEKFPNINIKVYYDLIHNEKRLI